MYPQLALATALAFCCAGCTAPLDVAGPGRAAAVASSANTAPTLDELQNMRYIGLGDSPGTVTLRNGRWAGAPATTSAASGAVVALEADLRLTGDMDGDGLDDAVVLLTHRTGGTAVWSYLAVVARATGGLRNVATVALGDRVQIRSARIADGVLSVSTVRAGPNDAACCPGELGEQQWALVGGRLVAQGNFAAGRLSLATLAGRTWVLRAWDLGEPAPVQPVVTLVLTGGAFTGRSGCNRYTAGVTPGDGPGELSVGPAAATLMACPEAESAVESRFLQQLRSARRFGFRAGRLALSSADVDGPGKTMLFEASTPSPAP
jgi:heat shock protein HslJ